MISYDQYKNRIQKIAKMRKFVLKYKFLFLAVFLIIVATTCSLLVSKGAVMGETVLSSMQINYGDLYEVTPASAFLSSTSIEYSAVGTDIWTAEKPQIAGKYLARTVSEKTIGHGYGKAVEFEILPIESEFIILSDSVVYGGIPAKYQLSNLVGTDSLLEEDLQFVYDDATAAVSDVTVDLQSIKIVDENGVDRTACYTLSSNVKKLTIDERPITLSTVDFNSVYNAEITEAFDYAILSEVSKKSLVNGDTIEFTTIIKDSLGNIVSHVSNVGDYYVEIDSYRIFKGEKDVTARYDVNIHRSDLHINPRPVTFTTFDGSRQFDGTPFGYERFTSDGLLGGHKAEASDFTQLIYVNEVANIANFTILDGNGVDVTSNYSIKCNFGQLRVDKCPVEVITASANRIYDGSTLLCREFDYDNLPEGFSFTILSNSWICNVGRTPNNLLLEVNDAEGTAVTENFDIHFVYGELQVFARPITVRTGDGEWVYDANEHFSDQYEVVEGSLVDWHSLIPTFFAVKDVTSALNNNVTTFTVWAEGYEEDVTSNYDIKYQYGTLIVTPRKIKVQTASVLRAYNAEPLFDYENYTTVFADDETQVGLVGGDRLIVGEYASIENVGECANACSYFAPNSNYQIVGDILYGTLTVQPRKIIVQTANAVRMYNAKPLFDYENYTTVFADDETQAGLIGRDKLIVDEYTSIENVGECANVCAYFVPNSNYQIFGSVLYGTLTVTPRRITVITADASKVYNGAPLFQYGDYKTCLLDDSEQPGLLSNGAVLTVESYKQVYSVGICDNVCEYRSKDPNYSVENVIYGKLTVLPAPLTVTLLSPSLIYGDASNYPVDSIGNYVSCEGLVNNEKLIVGVNYTQNGVAVDVPKNVGDYNVELCLDKCTVIGGEYSDISNYVVKCDNSVLTINKKEINVELLYLGNFTYGDYVFYPIYANNFANDVDLQYGEQLQISVNFSCNNQIVAKPKHVGRYTYVVDFSKWKIFNSDGSAAENVLNNYEVTCADVPFLDIQKKAINVKPYGFGVDYGNDNISYNSHFYGPSNFANFETCGLQYGEELEIFVDYNDNDTSQLPNAGNYVAYVIQDKTKIYGDDARLDNYDITYDNSNLKIYRREIYLVLNDAAFCYGDEITYPKGEGNYKSIDITLPYNQTLEVEVNFDCPARPLIGTYKIFPTRYIVRDMNGEIVDSTVDADYYVGELHNYNIVGLSGELTILARNINIVLSPVDDVIYGEMLSYPVGIDNYANSDTIDLAYNERLEVEVNYLDSNSEPAIPKNADTYKVYLSSINVFDENGNRMERHSYSFTSDDLSATVNRRPLTVKPEDKSIIYGQSDTLPVECEVATDAYNETFYYDVRYISDRYDEVSIAPRNVDVYTMQAVNYQIDGSEEGLANYFIDVYFGNLIIGPKTIYVELSYKELFLEYGETNFYPTGYGNFVNVDECELQYDEQLEVAAKYNYQDGYTVDCPKNVGYYTVSIDKDKSIIGDSFGTRLENGISNYEVVLSENARLEITPKAIVVVPYDLEYIYGEPQIYPDDDGNFVNADSCGLQYDEQMRIAVYFDLNGTETANTRNVGEYVIRVLKAMSLINGSRDGLDNYEITYESSILKVTPRPITVTLYNIITIYGDSLSYPDGVGNYKTVEFSYGGEFDSLVYDDTLEVTVSFNCDSRPYVGTYSIIPIGFLINGKSDTGNYEIGYRNGTLTVNPRPISIELLNVENVTYGQQLSYATGAGNFIYLDNNINSYRPAYDEQIEIAVEFYYEDGSVANKNAGKYKAEFNGFVVYSSNGEFLPKGTDNYIVTCSDTVSAEIYRKDLVITLDDIALTYGEIFPNNTSDSFVSSAYEELISYDVRFYSDSYDLTCVAPTNVGAYTMQAVNFLVNGFENGVANYVVRTKDGTLSILPKDVYIKLLDQILEYGNTDFYPESADNFEFLNDSSLEYDERLQVAVNYIQNDVLVRPKNVGVYSIQINLDGCTVFGYESSIGVSNYIVNCENAELTVTPKAIEVVPFSFSEIYGDLYTYPRFPNNFQNADYCGLAYGEQLQISVNYVGEHDVVLPNAGNYAILVDSSATEIFGVDVSLDNYEIVYNDTSRLSISPRPIIVTLNDVDAAYGDPFTYPNGVENYLTAEYAYDSSFRALVYGDTLEVKTEFDCGERPSVGTYDIISTEFIVNGKADSVNYLITTINGVLTITRRPITVELLDISGVTYGETFTFPDSIGNYANVDCGTAYGERLKLAYCAVNADGMLSRVPKNAGVYTILAMSYEVYDADDKMVENGADNYEVIEFTKKKAIIMRKNVSISLSDIVRTYDGAFHGYNNDYEVTYGEFAYGESLTVTVDFYASAKPTAVLGAVCDVGTYRMEFNDSYSLIGGVSANLNYNVTCNEATFIINPKSFTINLADTEHVYNGAQYVLGMYGSDFVVEGLCGEDTLDYSTVEYSGIPLYVGNYTVNYLTDQICLTNGQAANYVLDTEHSRLSCKLSIVKRQIAIIVNDFVTEYTGYAVNPANNGYISLSEFGFGFAYQDEQMLQYVYRYDGDYAAPKEIGEYVISLSFVDNPLLDNYDILSIQEGTLTVKRRIVEVTPVYIGDKLIYDGEKVGFEDLSFEHKRVSNRKEYGFEQEDLADITAEYTFMTSDYVPFDKGDSPINAGTYVVSVVLSGYNTEYYEVIYSPNNNFVIEQRELKVAIDDLTVTYSNSRPNPDPDFTMEGFLPQDVSLYETYVDYILNDVSVTRFDVGEYDITLIVKGVDESVADNYKIKYLKNAKLTVEKVVLHVKPSNYQVVYNGTDLSYYAQNEYFDRYEFLEEGESLALGDYMRIVVEIPATGKWNAALGILSVRVFSIGVDGENMDVTDNYVIYTDKNFKTEPNTIYRNAMQFKGMLSFVQRVVKFNQFVPGQKVFVYNGFAPQIEYDNPNALFEVLRDEQGDTGLLPGHSVVFRSVNVGKAVFEYTDWLLLKVVDSNGNDVSRYYNLTCVNKKEEKISVVGINVDIAFEVNLTIDKLNSGEALSLSAAGDTILNRSFYTVSGLMDGDMVDIIVKVEENGLYKFNVVIYEPTYRNGVYVRRERSINYAQGDMQNVPNGVSVQWIRVAEINN